MKSADIERAAAAIEGASALLIGAGAGMGVDSGLPDFRGPQGFWEAYPPYRHLGLSFTHLANPRWFSRDPRLAWGFYGHRLHLYRDTIPHAGFEILRRLASGRPTFVFTSNVDGQFQKAGFDEDQIYEVHGSIHWLQCAAACGAGIWSAGSTRIEVDESDFRAFGELPRCPRCPSSARPNILMFGDFGFLSGRAQGQAQRYEAWCRAHQGAGLAVIEVGAGSGVPTVRMESRAHLDAGAGALIRVNPREPRGPTGTISLASGALAALEQIEARLGRGR